MKKKIKVIVVDDSAFIRNVFSEFLNSDEDIEVVASASDPFDAREKIKLHNPDVITLDIEMPKMDGIDFLDKIMKLRPMPVVMVSTLTQKGAAVTLKALEMGAVDYVPKPVSNSDSAISITNLKNELITKVKVASRVRIKPRENIKPIEQLSFTPSGQSEYKLIAIGASTGGVEAIGQILKRMPKNSPPIVIVQHMPPGFTASFARRLNDSLEIEVYEASDNQKLMKGCAYIAPGHTHIKVIGNHLNGYNIRYFDGEKVSGHKPSVDVLFSSVANACREHGIGVILTGIGKDGAEGLLSMKRAGSYNIGQSAESCVVYGMPKSANLIGAVDIEMHIEEIAAEILKHSK